MSKRRKTERSVELLAEALGKRWGVTPRIAAGRALADALDREWDKLKALKEPRGVDHVREGEVAVMAQELWDEVGAFQVRQLVKFMWGRCCYEDSPCPWVDALAPTSGGSC